MTKQTDELAALKARVEELERKEAQANKPPEPFKSPPYQRWDPTEGMSMPPSALRAMVAAEPAGFMTGVINDNRGAPTGPTGMVPRSSSQEALRSAPGGGTGWQAPRPLSPPPGVAQADRLMDAQDQRDRAELIERDAKLQVMQTMAEQTEITRQQTEALAKLADPKKD
jgi:hypothetical protein